MKKKRKGCGGKVFAEKGGYKSGMKEQRGDPDDESGESVEPMAKLPLVGMGESVSFGSDCGCIELGFKKPRF